MVKLTTTVQTMMASVDDQIKHLQQQIEGAEEQVRPIE